MAKEVITKILEIEKENAVNLENAKLSAAQMVRDARTNAENFYNEEVSKAKEGFEKAILEARQESEKVIEKARSKEKDDATSIVSDFAKKKEKAIKEILESLV